uniref:Uncharacterized protein n=1 Tax=Glossina austeni TaxID=7395 RepID=A0A1A9UGZ8_GLOAU
MVCDLTVHYHNGIDSPSEVKIDSESEVREGNDVSKMGLQILVVNILILKLLLFGYNSDQPLARHSNRYASINDEETIRVTVKTIQHFIVIKSKALLSSPLKIQIEE